MVVEVNHGNKWFKLRYDILFFNLNYIQKFLDVRRKPADILIQLRSKNMAKLKNTVAKISRRSLLDPLCTKKDSIEDSTCLSYEAAYRDQFTHASIVCAYREQFTHDCIISTMLTLFLLSNV